MRPLCFSVSKRTSWEKRWHVDQSYQTLFDMDIIVGCHLSGLFSRVIATKLNRPKSTVAFFHHKWKVDWHCDKGESSGRPKIMTNRNHKTLKHQIINNRAQPMGIIRQGFQSSNRNVCFHWNIVNRGPPNWIIRKSSSTEAIYHEEDYISETQEVFGPSHLDTGTVEIGSMEWWVDVVVDLGFTMLRSLTSLSTVSMKSPTNFAQRL